VQIGQNQSQKDLLSGRAALLIPNGFGGFIFSILVTGSPVISSIGSMAKKLAYIYSKHLPLYLWLNHESAK